MFQLESVVTSLLFQFLKSVTLLLHLVLDKRECHLESIQVRTLLNLKIFIFEPFFNSSLVVCLVD